MNAIKEKLAAVDAACPCRDLLVPQHCAGVRRCKCNVADGVKECRWPGHAAVRELVEACQDTAWKVFEACSNAGNVDDFEDAWLKAIRAALEETK